jgi:hypothetical protein
MLQFSVEGSILELAIVLVIMFGAILFCIWISRKPNPQFLVTRTRPRSDRVDGFGGIKVTDYSYMDGKGGTLPVGFGTTPEREKPETYRIHKTKHEDAKKKEIES